MSLLVLWSQIELNLNLVFVEGRKVENPEKTPKIKEKNQSKLNPHVTPGLGIQPMPQWGEVSPFSSIPSSLSTMPTYYTSNLFLTGRNDLIGLQKTFYLLMQLLGKENMFDINFCYFHIFNLREIIFTRKPILNKFPSLLVLWCFQKKTHTAKNTKFSSWETKCWAPCWKNNKITINSICFKVKHSKIKFIFITSELERGHNC